MRGSVKWRTVLRIIVFAAVVLLAVPAQSQHGGEGHTASNRVTAPHSPVHGPVAPSGWEGSAEGKAYSEFNHHLAGVFVIVIGLSELHYALGVKKISWARFLLPVSMLSAGGFLLIWSDHEAWPIGSLSFADTFLGGDWEMLQHKLFGLLLLLVGTIEWLRRLGRLSQVLWRIPLPAFAILGGLSLFVHSHGAHPAAHQIAVHHAVMGVMAVTAGSTKLLSQWRRPRACFPWELAWSALILLIGLQLLLYAE